MAALAGVDGLAQRHTVQKVHLLDVHCGAGARPSFLGDRATLDAIEPHGTNLAGESHLRHVPGFAALDQTQSAVGYEPAYGPAHRPRGEPNAACQPHEGKLKAEI